MSEIIDKFFFYGKLDLDTEVNNDLLQGIIQPKRTMFYFREEGCGASDYENSPLTYNNIVLLKYEIVNWFAFRNSYISKASDNLPERRALTSQNIIDFEIDSQNGEANLYVYYIPLTNIKQMQKVII
jgi:hypothetical protein